MKKGFSLVELMVVVAIIAILSTIALYGITKAQASARDVQRQQIMNGIRTALERYYNDNQYYPGKGPVGYEWTGNAASPISVLTAASYLAAPEDPCRRNGVTITIPDTGVMGTGDCEPTAYTYNELPDDCTTANKNCTGYELVLTKESGGSSTFKSPQ